MTSGVSAANNKPGSQPPLRLAARYYWLLLFVILPLFVIVVLLGTFRYRDQRAQLLQDLAQSHATYTIALEAIAKAASNHVLQMKSWSEHYLANPPERPSALRKYFTPHWVDGVLDGYTLDEIPEHLQPYIGQLFWLREDPRNGEVGRVVLDHALDFFSLVRLTHEVTPYFQWSYYFPANQTFFNMYPWESTNAVLDYLGTPSMRKSIHMLYTFDFYLSATPQKNPQRKPYWTAPYVDAAGTGTMVTHGAPVYVDNEFHGLVATDLRLSTLEHFLLDLPLDVGRLLILDDEGLVLSDSEGSPRDVIRKASEVIPAVFVAREQGFVPLNAENPQAINGYSVMARNTVHAPWTLVYLIRDQEIEGLLRPRLLPYRVILIVLGVTVFLALYLLRREFISPALAMVHFIRDASSDPTVKVPQLPPLWQKWADTVSNAFVANRETTRKLRESEKRLQQILNNSSKVIYVRDLEGRFLLINKAFERLFGITQKELKGKRMDAVFPSHTVTEFQTNDLKVIGRDSVMEFEEQVALDDGVHTYLSIKYPLYDSEGKIYAICGVSADISKRKQSEEALRLAALGISKARGAELFNTLVIHLSKAIGSDYAFIGVLEKADKIRTRALYAHGRIEANFSYSLEGTPGETVVGQQFRFYPDGIQRRFPKSLLQEIGMHSYAAIPLFDSGGRALGLLGVLHGQPLQDEPFVESILKIFAGRAAGELERERADAALRASEEQYRSIFNAASDALILWDARGKMVDVNPAAWEMGGYTKEEFLGKPFHDHIHPPSISAYEQFKLQLAKAKASTVETRAICKDGTVVDLESRSIPMPYQGQPHLLTISRDITEQKRVAKELARQREALRQSEKMSTMGELLASVAHELNNPLAILMGRTALLENKTNDPALKTEVKKIHGAADRCGRIIHTFLSMARQKPPERKLASLNEVVRGALELLGYSLHTTGIALDARLAEDLPKQHMDIDQIGQVVINLLVNAQHVLAERPKPRRIDVETGKSNGSTYFRVADNGSGVPEALRERIFDPFFTTKEGSLGTGIGLSVSRSIAREHGGQLGLEDSQQGAVFVLSLPLDPVGEINAPVDEPLAMKETQGSHVLVVEDEPEVADLLVEILQSAGLKASWASSGLKALEWLQRHRCDLILSDIRMPDMDGSGLWRALKEHYPGLLGHTAFITGDTLSAGVAPFLKETGAPLLEKPFTPEQVLTLVARLEPD